MIFYEFVLSWKHSEDPRFAKNALLFAPDLTIIDSPREIHDIFGYASGNGGRGVRPVGSRRPHRLRSRR